MTPALICLFLYGMLHAEHAAADVNEAMKIGKAVSKFMPAGHMPRPVIQDSDGTSVVSSPTQSDLIMQSAMLKTLADMEARSQELADMEARIQNMPQADQGSAPSFGWLAGFIAFVGLSASVGVAAVKKYSSASVARMPQPQMYDISAFDDIWSREAKEEIYQKWNPEQPRDYNNFNPFERNDEGQMCDSNGCYPGQDGGYKPPNRPDVSWASQQEHAKRMEELKAEAKFNLTGKPGNWKKGWADNLGPTP
jgi:hypothetical protein